jgi:hypothetical protein
MTSAKVASRPSRERERIWPPRAARAIERSVISPEARVPLKQQFLSKALTLLQDPRVAKVLQDPRVMSGIMGAMKLQSDVKRSVEERVQRVVKSLHLASESEVQELQRAVARLERELERTRNQRREPPEGRTVS